MFSDRIFPPVSGGNRGRGTVSKTFIVIVPKAAKKRTQLGETANLLSVNDHSSTLSHSGFPQVTLTVQEYTVPKLKIQWRARRHGDALREGVAHSLFRSVGVPLCGHPKGLRRDRQTTDTGATVELGSESLSCCVEGLREAVDSP